MSREALVQHLTYLLLDGGAHLSFEAAIANLEPRYYGVRGPGMEHTLWRQLEHMRICQWDILEFSTNQKHVSPHFPEGYWPASDSPPTESAWNECVEAFQNDRQAMIDLINDPKVDLFEKIPHGDGQTILREAMLIADHNAYHLGQIVLLRRCLGCWEE